MTEPLCDVDTAFNDYIADGDHTNHPFALTPLREPAGEQLRREEDKSVFTRKRTNRADRKETMKVYMRNYRKRQKMQIESMSTEEKEAILEKQRQRVRERVRRHRLRKKLREKGLSTEEVEQQVNVPFIAETTGFYHPSNFPHPPTMITPAVCLDGNSNSIFNPKNTYNPVADESYIETFRPTPENEVNSEDPISILPNDWTSAQVSVFLKGLDMSELRYTFELNGIDGKKLINLTEDMMKNVLAINDPETRLNLLSAINSLKKVAKFY
jgi:hypothetical protein